MEQAMSIDQEVEILRRIPIFAKIEPAKLKLMAFASERVTYKPGQALFRQGERGEAAFIVLQGTADVLKHGNAEYRVEGGVGEVVVKRIAGDEPVIRLFDGGYGLRQRLRGYSHADMADITVVLEEHRLDFFVGGGPTEVFKYAPDDVAGTVSSQ